MIQFVVHCIVFFFFKQKTAYEMRISDWSSDVCSSDLAQVQGAKAALDNAQLDLDYTEIRAPVGGRIDRNFISVGNLVSPDETILTRIVSLDRKSVVSGKSGSVRVDLGGRRSIKKKNTIKIR